MTPEQFVSTLLRPPRRWDSLVYALGLALADTCSQLRARLFRDELRIKPQLFGDVGHHFACGFEIFLQQWLWGRYVSHGPTPDLLNLDDASARRVADVAAIECFDPLLRRWVEDTQDALLPRPDRETEVFVAALADATARFLSTHCLPGQDLHGSLADPMAPAGDALPDNGLETPLPAPSGNPSLDLRRLALRIEPADDADMAKGKLIAFVRVDPWMNTELTAEIAAAQADALEDAYAGNPSMLDDRTLNSRMYAESITVTDEVCYSATRLDGKTPVDILIERQPDMDPAQRARLERWNRETFYGVFVIRRNDKKKGELLAMRIGNDREYRLIATRPEALSRITPGTVFTSRVVPWDDYWLLSGLQQTLREATDADVPQIRALLLRQMGNRIFDPSDPVLQRAWELQYEYHAVWMETFGTEELLFQQVEDVRAEMGRFGRARLHRPWRDGLSPAENYEKEHGRPYPKEMETAAFPLPESWNDPEANDLAVIFDREAGILYQENYRRFLSAIEAGAGATPRQAQVVYDFLIEPTIDPVIFQRVTRRDPAGMEGAIRVALRDATFQLDRDFDRLLRKYKGEDLRKPRRPFISVLPEERSAPDAHLDAP